MVAKAMRAIKSFPDTQNKTLIAWQLCNQDLKWDYGSILHLGIFSNNYDDASISEDWKGEW